MLPHITIAFLFLGFLVAIVGGLSRGYVRSRLPESGVTLKAWVTLADELRYAEMYLALAKSRRFPRAPALLTILWLPGAFLLMGLGVMLSR